MSFKFNVFTGKFDIVETNEPNFSYIYIDETESVEVQSGQEMITQKDILVDGDLMVSGETFQLPDYSKLCFFWTKITADESIRIPANRLLIYVENIMVDGNLMVDGDLLGVSNGNWF